MQDLDLLANAQKQAADQLQQDLLASGCAALVGEYRMGKTSTLMILKEILPSPRVYVSLAEGEELIPPDLRFYTQILQPLQAEYPGLLSARSLADCANEIERYDSFERALEQLPQPSAAILIDDADRLLDAEWGKRVFQRLRRLVEARTIQIVLAGPSRLERLADRLRHETGKSGLWHLVPSPYVLMPISSQQVRDSFFKYPQLAEKLIELCGGHPYCLRVLTGDLTLFDISPDRLPDMVEEFARQRSQKWNETFRHYFGTYDGLTRRLCYLLTALSEGLDPYTIRARLSQSTENEIDVALNLLRRTGVLLQDDERQLLRLIGLFRRWYQGETGFVENVLMRPRVEPMITPPAAEQTPTTELTFFPEHDLVLIRRNRFVSYSKLGITSGRLSTIRTKTRRVPANDSRQFLTNLQVLSEDLWVELRDKDWFEILRRGVDDHHHLHLNIPVELGEFPFELLPLDETGTRLIGMYAPISRQLVKQGLYVERAPLDLKTGKKLSVLVVAAEVGGDVALDPDGRVYSGSRAQIMSGERINLARLDLTGEVKTLYEALTGRPDLVSEVTFLAQGDLASHSAVTVRREAPTAEMFANVLRDTSRQFDVLHFAGHGLAIADRPEEGGLLFGDQLVHLTELKSLLKAQKQLGFVYLSCCESGQLATDERTSGLLGLAHVCVEAGVPAVLAMRWRITADASRKLSRAFYDALFEKQALDLALSRAVETVYDQERDPAKKVYAAAPVLIMH